VSAVHLLAGIAWDPQIRGFLAVLVGVVVLMGSVYLLLGTNLGSRLGFLVALSAIFGWCTLMGITWWVYGTIGMLGDAPKWVIEEVVYAEESPEAGLDLAGIEEAHDLDTSTLPDADELKELDIDAAREVDEQEKEALGGWVLLPESNPSFGEAKATVDEHFVESPDEQLEIDSADDYITLYSFQRGGKETLPQDPSRMDRIVTKLKTTFWQIQHPPRYAIIQLQPVIPDEQKPGQAPPTPRPDRDKPVVSVIMSRDLGDVRFPGAMLTIFSGAMFLATLLMLHRRDLEVARARGLATGPAEA
jgi:hypothetical protein